MPLDRHDDQAPLDNFGATVLHKNEQALSVAVHRSWKKSVGRLLLNYVDLNAGLHPQGQDFTPASHKNRHTCGHVSHVMRFVSYICRHQVSFAFTNN